MVYNVGTDKPKTNCRHNFLNLLIPKFVLGTPSEPLSNLAKFAERNLKFLSIKLKSPHNENIVQAYYFTM